MRIFSTFCDFMTGKFFLKIINRKINKIMKISKNPIF